MIDKNKPLADYTKAELLDALNSKKELDSYFLLNQVYAENRQSDRYYSYFEDFLQMVHGKTSFTRMRGFGLCASLARWDADGKIDEHLQEMLILLEDEKPTTVRVALSFIPEMLQYKPHLKKEIKAGLGRIDCSRYKDTMAPLIQKDVASLEGLLQDA